MMHKRTKQCMEPGCSEWIVSFAKRCRAHAEAHHKRCRIESNRAVYARTAKPEEIDRWVAELAQLTGLRKGGVA